MPLVSIALAGYAAGLLAGLHGALLPAAALAALLLLASVLRRSLPLAASALIIAAGLAVGRAAERADHACAIALARSAEWTATALAPLAPGESVPVDVSGDGCELAAWVTVVAGTAPAGATVIVRGVPRGGPRGLALGDARIVTVRAPPPLLDRWRAAIGASIDRAFGEDAPLARALLVADTRSLSRELRDDFAAAGLVHMLSISGLHVGIIAMAVAIVLGAARVPRSRAAGATVAVTAAYVGMIGAPAPALRSLAMLAAGEASRALQRPTSPWAALAIGAATPLVQPRLVDDVGYQLSVVGMIGLIASGALTRRLLTGRLRGWRHAIAAAALTSVVASVVTGPLVAWRFGRTSLVAPLTNVVATPIVTLLQPMLFLAMLLGWWPAGARFAAGAAHPLLAAFVWVAHAGAAIPGAQIETAARTAALVLAGIASALVVAACVRRDWAPPAAGALACLVLIAWTPVAPWRSGRVELHMIDVGQGDALALRTPRGRWIVFDAGRAWRGGDAGASTVVPYLRARGGEVVAFVLSHPHADHAGGAATLLRATRPALYVDAGYPGPSGPYLESLHAARERGVRWERVHPGDSLVVDGVVLSFLAPDSAWTAALDDANLASTIVRIRYGRTRFLLTGDAEEPEEQWLLDHARDGLAAEVLKVAHHGSTTSTSPPFLAAVHPRLALVSVGAGNSYGHPGPDVMRRLAAAGVEVLRTDRLGTVIVSTDGVALSVHIDGRGWELSP